MSSKIVPVQVQSDSDKNIKVSDSSKQTKQIVQENEESHLAYVCHIIIGLAAALCFLPQMLGYHTFLDFYPADALKTLPDDKQLYTSLIVSISLTAVTLFESFLDSLTEMSKRFFKSIKSESTVTYFKFPKSILILILAKDMLILFYILPYQQYDLLVGLYLSVDILFVWCYFYNLTRLGNPVWTLPKVFTMTMIFVSVTIAYAWIAMSEAATYNNDLFVVFQVFSIIFFLLLLIATGQWIHYVWKMCHEPSTDALTYLKLIQASIFVTVFIIYLVADFGTPLSTTTPPEWYFLSSNYLSLMIYIMAGCTVCVTITSSAVSKLCGMILSNKLLEVREMFMRYLSHEMRTPLNTVVMGVNLLIKKFENILCLPKTSICYEIAYDIRSSCMAAVDILNDMLLFDKIESGHLALELAVVSPWSFIQETVQTFFVQAQSAELKLLLKFMIPSFECFVNVDKHKLSQVIRNLISNGLKFCKRDDGCVTVEVDVISFDTFKEIVINNQSSNDKKDTTQKMNTPDDTQYLRLAVTDDGAGISEENQSKLFKSIIQFKAGELQNGQGTGLGLYISKGLIDAHKGHIFVKSDGEGHGSTFTFLIPIEKKYTPMLPKESIVSLAGLSSKFSILKDKDDTSAKGDGDTKKKNIIDIFDLNQVYTFSSTDVMVSDVTLEIAALSINPLTIATEDEFKSDDLNHNNRYPMLGVSSPVDIESPLRVINILVVDDSAICRLMVKRTIDDLKIEGCRMHIDEASDGKKALKMMKIIMNVDDNETQTSQTDSKTPTKKKKSLTENIVTAEAVYDLILMDYQMPNMDGPTSISHIRALGYKGQIIGLTGNVVETEVEKMRTNGANKVLTKPVKEEQFNSLFLTL